MPPKSGVKKKKKPLARKPQHLQAKTGGDGSSQEPASPSEPGSSSQQSRVHFTGVGHDDDDDGMIMESIEVAGDTEPEDDMDDDDDDYAPAAVGVVDLDAYRYGALNSTDDDRTVLALVDNIDLNAATDYEEKAFDQEEPISTAFEDNIGGDDEPMHDVDEPRVRTPSPVRSSPFIPVEVRPKDVTDPTDTSVLLEHKQNRHLVMSKFEKGLALYADLTGMSRPQWEALRELLQLLDVDGKPHPDVRELPKQLATIKSRIRTRLPLMDMRKASIPLKIEKLPTDTSTEKRDRKGKGKAKEVEIRNSDLYFLDPTSIFTAIMSSDIREDMHIGPALFVDLPTELFESHAWASSVRTSSGIYPHLQLGDGQLGGVIFPSDFIFYRCGDTKCGCQKLDEASSDFHIGRVYGFGYDRRSSPCTDNANELVLQVQEAYYSDSPYMPFALQDMLPAWDYEEILLITAVSYIPEGNVLGTADVFIDRVSGEIHDDPQPAAAFVKNRSRAQAAHDEARKRWEDGGRQGEFKGPKVPQAFPKYYTATITAERTENQQLVARRIFDVDANQVIPLCHTHALRAELELEQYDRALFEMHWDTAQEDALPTLSVPLLSFIDGFGVYRNSYRSLMGFYVTPAALPEDLRSREANIFPLALGPHGSDFSNVIKALRTMRYLDEGIEVDIRGQKYRLCAFTICYTGDMPQQAENSGFKGPRAHKFCRFCFAGAKPDMTGDDASSAILNTDTVAHGRYHLQTKQMHDMMDRQLKTKSEQNQYGAQWGINDAHPALQAISPALDLVLSRPPDAAHSEYKGIANLMHFLLRDGILTKTARVEYASVLRGWPFPPGAPRLQSPTHHLGSYSMSDHGRWTIIIPALLRDWLEEKHLMPRFVAQIQQNQPDASPVDVVVSTTAAIAKSNSVLMGRKMSDVDRKNMGAIIRRARTMFNQLNIYASQSVGSRAASVASIQGETAQTAALDDRDDSTAKRARQYIADTMRPNAHIGIHYPEIAHEYGLPKNVDSLEGEAFHKIMKNRVYETNFSNIEKILLEKLNVTKTARLVLRNVTADDNNLTDDLVELYKEAPSLFSKVLSETDRAQLDGVDDDDFELDVSLSTNDSHLRASVINRMPAKEAKAMFHPANEQLTMPLRAGQITDTFRTLLRSAYEDDYGFAAGEPVALGNAPIQWSRKFAFDDGTDKHETKYVFSTGDYVRFHGDHFGRVDAIMVFDCMGIYRHIFIVLMELERAGDRDPVLDLEVMKENHNPIIVGLPAIEPVKTYMVPVTNVGTVLVDWDVYYK